MDELTLQFRGEIEAFLSEYGIKPSTFGLAAVNDHKLVRRLREDKTVTLETAHNARGFMSSYVEAHKAGTVDDFLEGIKKRREERLKSGARRKSASRSDKDNGSASVN